MSGYNKKIIQSIITSLRNERNLTQNELENKLSLSKGLVSHYETGRNDLSVELIIKYADLFDVSTDYILNRCESKTNYSKYIDKTIEDDITIGMAIDMILKMSKRQRQCLTTILKEFNKNKK